MLISVHLPKTAGVSFGVALEAHFGRALQKDYADYPINTPVDQRCRAAVRASIDIAEQGAGGVACVHGHFLPLKYLLLNTQQDLTFITWMRNPVERIISHYFYWRRSYSPSHALPLHRKVIEEDWPLERFAFCAELRNLYSQFLWCFPLEQFDFIGVTEYYEEDFQYFSHAFLATPLESHQKNVGERRGERYEIGSDLRRKIELYHARDMNLYQHALNKRRTRVA